MAAILASDAYTREEKILLLALIMNTTPAGVATVPRPVLAHWTSMSERHVGRTVHVLEDQGVVTTTRSYGHGSPASYRLNLARLALTTVTTSASADQSRFDPGRSVHHRVEMSRDEAKLALGAIRTRMAEIEAALSSDMQAIDDKERLKMMAQADQLQDLADKYESFLANYATTVAPPGKTPPQAGTA